MSLVEDENDVVTNVEIEGEETKVACTRCKPWGLVSFTALLGP